MDNSANTDQPVPKECVNIQLPVKDALEILGGKWKLQIIIALSHGTRRFKDLSRVVSGISDRMLSKELKELECNQLIKRNIIDSFPPVVEYSITEHGKTLDDVIGALRDWGIYHRKKIIDDMSDKKEK